jgi:uncharacterized membrane protein YkoI
MSIRTTIRSALAAGVLGALLVTATAHSVASDDDDDQAKAAQVRALLESGEIVPMRQVLERVHEEGRGHVLEAELERKRDGYVYEIEVLDEQGIVHEYDYDAQTGEALDGRP